MCEPLRGMLVEIKTEDDVIHRVFHEDRVKSAVEFYRRYKDNPAKLMKEKPDEFSNLMQLLSKGISFVDYCFGDVIG